MFKADEGGDESMLLDLGLLEVLLFQSLFVESSLGLVLARGVLSVTLASTRVVVTQASLLLSLLRATGNKVFRVATFVAFIL